MTLEINGTGPGRDAFDMLIKAVREGKVRSFMLRVDYTDALKQELAREKNINANGVSASFGTIIELSNHVVQLALDTMEKGKEAPTPADGHRMQQHIGVTMLSVIAEKMAERYGMKAIISRT